MPLSNTPSSAFPPLRHKAGHLSLENVRQLWSIWINPTALNNAFPSERQCLFFCVNDKVDLHSGSPRSLLTNCRGSECIAETLLVCSMWCSHLCLSPSKCPSVTQTLEKPIGSVRLWNGHRFPFYLVQKGVMQAMRVGVELHVKINRSYQSLPRVNPWRPYALS